MIDNSSIVAHWSGIPPIGVAVELSAQYIADNPSLRDELNATGAPVAGDGSRLSWTFRSINESIDGTVELASGFVVRRAHVSLVSLGSAPLLPEWIASKARELAPSIMQARRYRPISLRELLESPDPPDNSICKALGLSHGDRPMGIIGYGGSGKSWILIWLALQLVTGRPLFGNSAWQIARCYRVLHLDYELNRRVLKKRYADMCTTMSIDHAIDVDGRLFYGEHPDFYLTDGNAEELFSHATEGFDIVMIDALRPACPGEDENDSRFRAYVDICTRIAMKTGRFFVLLHHTGHVGKNQSAEPRGTAAIRDALGAVFAVHGDMKKPKRVENTKMAPGAGDIIEPFYVEFKKDNDGNGPMRLSYMTQEQGEDKQNEIDRPSWVRMQKRILHATRDNPGITRNKLRDAAKGNRGAFDRVLSWLLSKEFIDNKGTEQRHKYELAKLGQEWLDKGTATQPVATSDAPPDSRPELPFTQESE